MKPGLDGIESITLLVGQILLSDGGSQQSHQRFQMG